MFRTPQTPPAPPCTHSSCWNLRVGPPLEGMEAHGRLSAPCLSASGITVLLSLTVFMLLVAEIMPATSDSVPLIGKGFRAQAPGQHRPASARGQVSLSLFRVAHGLCSLGHRGGEWGAPLCCSSLRCRQGPFLPKPLSSLLGSQRLFH